MRLDDLDPSENVRDLGRGGGGGFGGGFGGGGGGGGLLGLLFAFLPMLLGRKMGCGTVLIIAVIGFFVVSTGALNFSAMTGAPSEQAAGGSGHNVPCDTAAELESCRIVGSLEKTWQPLFAAAGAQFRPATLNFFDQENESGCGVAQSAMGPFYCPADQGIYIDTAFFSQMEQMGAGGDFARAYVVAHEYGHHIQTLEGTSDQVRQAQARASQADGNAIQVRMELQADCYAGVWAARNPDRIEPGDLEEGMRAANAIGDDTLMRQAGQSVRQENFTHGSSEQRMTWLRRGAQSGDPSQCDTFSARL